MEFWRERDMGSGCDVVFVLESCRGREPLVRSAVVEGPVVVNPVSEAIAVLLRVLVEELER